MARKRKPSGLPDKGKKQGRFQNNARPLRAYFLIVCEGKETEPNYFECFKEKVRVSAKVKVEGLGDNTLSLVKRACKLRQQEDYTDVWVVFDHDSFPAKDFNEAITLAGRRGIQVAYSNEAFELWYLLHFHYHDSATSRDLYKQMLTERLGFPYQKNDPRMYKTLESRQHNAIRNAQTLLDSYDPDPNPEKDNPCTTVHLLVQELNRYER